MPMPIAVLNRTVVLALAASRALQAGAVSDPTEMASLLPHYRDVYSTHCFEISKVSVVSTWYVVTGKELAREHVRYPVISAQLKELKDLRIPLVLKQSVFEL